MLKRRVTKRATTTSLSGSFSVSGSLRKSHHFLHVISSSRFSSNSAFPPILKVDAQTAYTHTRERESVYETTRYAASSPQAGRLHGLLGRVRITTCSKQPDSAIAITTCKATQAQCPNSNLLSGHTREHRRAIRNRFSMAAGTTDFLGHRRLPRLFRRESIRDLSASPYPRFLP